MQRSRGFCRPAGSTEKFPALLQIDTVSSLDPEVASIGLTEAEARDRGYTIHTHSFEFADLDRAVLHGDARGLVKLVTDMLDGQILGAHLIGPDSSSIIAELAICMKHHLPITAIAETMHAYPSFPEAVEAAALSTPV